MARIEVSTRTIVQCIRDRFALSIQRTTTRAVGSRLACLKAIFSHRFTADTCNTIKPLHFYSTLVSRSAIEKPLAHVRGLTDANADKQLSLPT